MMTGMMESDLLRLQNAWRHAFAEWHFHRTYFHEEEERYARIELVNYKQQIKYEMELLSKLER